MGGPGFSQPRPRGWGGAGVGAMGHGPGPRLRSTRIDAPPAPSKMAEISHRQPHNVHYVNSALIVSENPLIYSRG